jgi:MFS family permease
MSITTGVAFYAHWLVMILFLTEVWGYSLVKAGLLLTIMPGTMSFLSIYAGKIADRHGERWVMIPGIFVYTALYIVFWSLCGTSESLWLLIPALIGSGIGMAGVWPTLTSLAARGIEENLIGSATAIIHTLQRIGGALGIAFCLAIVGETSGPSSFSPHRSGVMVIVIGGLATFLCSIFLTGKSEENRS